MWKNEKDKNWNYRNRKLCKFIDSGDILQGIYYYNDKRKDDAIGLMHWEIGGYKPSDLEVKLAFDIDERKVGYDVNEAILAKPNCTKVFNDNIPLSGVKVKMGKALDSVAEHIDQYNEEIRFVMSKEEQPTKDQVVNAIKDSGVEILVNYLPVSSENTVKFYAECALEAEVGFINNMPVFIASNEAWAKKFEEKNIPIIGDDIKSQLGATIVQSFQNARSRD